MANTTAGFTLTENQAAAADGQALRYSISYTDAKDLTSEMVEHDVFYNGCSSCDRFHLLEESLREGLESRKMTSLEKYKSVLERISMKYGGSKEWMQQAGSTDDLISGCSWLIGLDGEGGHRSVKPIHTNRFATRKLGPTLVKLSAE